ncbi:aryl-sulfate sulfotransferase [Calditrichota bacterium]
MLSGFFSISSLALDVTLPPDFYTYTVEVNNDPSVGYFYLDPNDYNQVTHQYGIWSIIMDNNGYVKYFYKGMGKMLPFPDSEVFALRFPNDQWRLFDLTYANIDTLSPANGYLLDGHELLVRGTGENISYWLLIRDLREIDMSLIVEGGDQDAIVWGSGIQKFNAEKELVWEWLSLDHQDDLLITNVYYQNWLLGEEVDYLHSNSFWISDDEDYLFLSNRTQSSIVKIKIGADDEYDDGEVIWHLGGGVGNQFTFMNDIEGEEAFLLQHDVTRLNNGNIILFDNGDIYRGHITRIKEYSLDEESLIATLVWSYVQDPPSFSNFAGGTHRDELNGSTIIGWGGGRTNDIIATEINSDGEVAWELSMRTQSGDSQPGTYRVSKTGMLGVASIPYLVYVLEERTATLTCNWFGHEDDVASYNIYMDDSTEPTELFGNTGTGMMIINNLIPNVSHYVRIKALDADSIEISDFSNEIEITPYQGVDGNRALFIPAEFHLSQNFPNPFNPVTSFRVSLPVTSRIKVLVYNILGHEVGSIFNGVMTAGVHDLQFDGTDIASGIYIVKFEAPGKFEQVKKMVLMK